MYILKLPVLSAPGDKFVTFLSLSLSLYLFLSLSLCLSVCLSSPCLLCVEYSSKSFTSKKFQGNSSTPCVCDPLTRACREKKALPKLPPNSSGFLLLHAQEQYAVVRKKTAKPIPVAERLRPTGCQKTRVAEFDADPPTPETAFGEGTATCCRARRNSTGRATRGDYNIQLASQGSVVARITISLVAPAVGAPLTSSPLCDGSPVAGSPSVMSATATGPRPDAWSGGRSR